MINLPLPSWRQLFGKFNYEVEQTSYWGGKDIVYTRNSVVSLALIFSAFRYITKSNKVDVYVPEFLGRDILGKIEHTYVQFHTYEVGDDFEPVWKKIQKRKEKIDIFIFCHFLGVHHDINRAKIFCGPRDIILIEDCTHVLYPATTYGKVGDFVIYSPYKVLPVPDGGLLVRNKSNNKTVECIYHIIAKKCNNSAHYRQFVWRVEKAIQKIINVQGKTYIYELQSRRKYKNKELNSKISSYAIQLIEGISYKEFKRMAYIRRCNVQVMNYLIGQIDNRAHNVITSNVECPYAAAYLLEGMYDKNKFIRKLRTLGIEISYPLDLSKKVKNINSHFTEKDKSRSLISVPIHQGIKPQQIARRIPLIIAKQNMFSLEWLDDSKKGKEKYQDVNKRIEFGNIPQEWDYGEVKCRVEHWKVKRAVVKDQDNQAIGIVQILEKQKGGITIAVRVNRGPLLISDYDNVENKLIVMELIRKKIPHPIPIIYAPNIEFTGENLVFATTYGWKQWNLFGFSSGIIDLQTGQGEIRKSFEKHWRNRLAYAERGNPEIKMDFRRFEEILDLYEQSQTEKKFVGIPRNVLQGLLHLKNTPLQLMYLTNEEDEIIAFDIFYVTNSFGLYLVGWNSPEGRKRYLNNLLFYNAAVKFKKEGIRWLDLGGIDYIETEENARFKDGMRPKHFQLLGEFIKF